MRNENNIINQMINDENIPVKKNWLEYVKDIYDVYINTLNNETIEYMNVENQKIFKNEIFKASDFSLKINNQDYLEIGNCMRETFFRFKNSFQNPFFSKDKEEIEKNILIKEQFLRKVRLVDLVAENVNEIVNFCGLNIETTNDGVIYDYSKDKEYLLFIKPVNDSSYIVKNKIFNNKIKTKPLNYHIPEILLNIILSKKPAKIIYIGKINPDNIVEFNIGINNGIMTVDGIEENYFNISLIIESLKYFALSVAKDFPPSKIFTDEKINQKSTILDMNQFGIIEEFEVNRLLNQEMYVNFQCKNCLYKNICRPEFVNNEE